MAGGYARRGAPMKRRRVYRSRGLVPTYRGWQPRQFQRGEWKYLDTAISVAVNTAGTITLLNGMQQGNTASTRVGMKISIRSIEWKGYHIVTAGTGADQMHRFMLLIDRQTNATGPTALTDFLSTGNVIGLRNLAARKRFKIALDKFYTLNATGESGSRRAIKFYMKLRRPLVVEYNAADNGTVADIVSNSLHLITIGSEAAGVTAGSIAGNMRIRYTDI